MFGELQARVGGKTAVTNAARAAARQPSGVVARCGCVCGGGACAGVCERETYTARFFNQLDEIGMHQAIYGWVILVHC
jgi:hypothetical protein